MNKKYLAIIVILTVFCFTGCASIGYRMSNYGSYREGIYPGVREDVDNIMTGGPCMDICFPTANRILNTLDTPLSFVLDTVCLPYDTFKNYDKETDDQKNANTKEESSAGTVNKANLENKDSDH